MTPERRKEVAAKGGRTAHALGTAHEFTSASAKVAGAKGGMVTGQDRERMSKIAKDGAKARWNKP